MMPFGFRKDTCPKAVLENLERIWYQVNGRPDESHESYTLFNHDIRVWCSARADLNDDQRDAFDGLSFTWRSTGDELVRCCQAL